MIELKKMEEQKHELVQIVAEIENDVRRLLEENLRLKNQVFEISLKKESQEDSHRVNNIEEEIKKIRQIVSELQNQEIINRDRIFQIRKLIQEEINNKYSKEEEQKNSFSKIEKETPLTFKSEPLDKEAEVEVDYNPYIGVDEEDVITHQPVVGIDDEENFSPVSIKPKPEEKRISTEPEEKRISTESEKKRISTESEEKLISTEPEEKRISTESEKKRISTESEEKLISTEPEEKPISTEKTNSNKETELPRHPNNIYVEKPKLKVGENPNSFLINDFAKEEDPFGDEDSKIDDDEFFKSNS